MLSMPALRRKLGDIATIARERYHVRAIYSRNNGLAPKAITFYFDVTNLCNLRCEMCYLRDVLNKKVKGGALTNEEFLHFVDRDGIKRVNLIGGEPFLRKDLPELLVEFERRRIICETITTNGTLITEEHAAQLAHLVSLGLLNSITISIDGPGRVHDQVRGNGIFAKASEGIHILREHLLRAGHGAENRLVLNSVICAENYAVIDNMADVAKRLGIRSICLCHLMYATPEEVAQTNAILGNDDPSVFQMYICRDPGIKVNVLRETLRHFRRKVDQFGINAMTRPNVPDEAIDHIYSPGYRPPLPGCMQPFFVSRVGTSGKVYYCTFIRKEMGDLRKQELSEIWNSDVFVSHRRTMVRMGIFPICKRCCKMYLRR